MFNSKKSNNASIAKRVAEIFNVNSNFKSYSSGIIIDESSYSNNRISFNFGLPKPYPFNIINEGSSSSSINYFYIDESDAPRYYTEKDFISVEDLIALTYELKDKRISESLIQIFKFLHEEGYEPFAPTLSTIKDTLFIRFAKYGTTVGFQVEAEFK